MSIKGTLDAVYTFRFIKTLVLDWKKTEAYKLGLLDDKGTKIRSPETREEKNAYTFFHRVVFNIKRLFEMLPGSLSRKLASYAAALRLLKEATGLPEEQLLEMFRDAGIEFEEDDLNESVLKLELNSVYTLQKDIPVYINESVDFEARSGSSVIILEEADVAFGQQFYKAKHLLSDQEIYLTAHDISENSIASVSTGNIADIPRPLRMPNGDKYRKFKVSPKVFNHINSGRNRYQRWDKYLDLNDENQCQISKFAKKYRDATIVIEDESTGHSRALKPCSLGDYTT